MSQQYYESWPEIRLIVLERDDFRCQFCGKTQDMARRNSEDGRGLEVHHIVPSRIGGRDHPDNLITACRSCHGAMESCTRQLLQTWVKPRVDGDLAQSTPSASADVDEADPDDSPGTENDTEDADPDPLLEEHTEDEPAGDLAGTIAAVLDEIDSGTRSNQFAARDDALNALLVALDEHPEQRQQIGDALQAALDREPAAGYDRSTILRLAARVGLQEAAPDVFEELKEGVQRYAAETV